jgi:predicted nucleic acid-binding protein
MSTRWVAGATESMIRYGPMRLRSAPFSFPLLIGELACGSLANRAEIISLLQELPHARVAEHDEVLRFIEARRLSARGLGFIDAHLLASSVLTRAPLWTADKRLPKWAWPTPESWCLARSAVNTRRLVQAELGTG